MKDRELAPEFTGMGPQAAVEAHLRGGPANTVEITEALYNLKHSETPTVFAKYHKIVRGAISRLKKQKKIEGSDRDLVKYRIKR